MRFVERPVAEDLLVNRAGGDEHEASCASRPGRFNQTQGSEHVPFSELDHVPLAAAETAAGMKQRGMHHGIAIGNQGGRRRGVSQIADDPLEPVAVVKAAEIAGFASPTAQLMALR